MELFVEKYILMKMGKTICEVRSKARIVLVFNEASGHEGL
jgi:hypothetical protein